jgi:hypothetical protein
LQTLPAAQSVSIWQPPVSPPQAERSEAEMRQSTLRAGWNDDFMEDLRKADERRAHHRQRGGEVNPTMSDELPLNPLALSWSPRYRRRPFQGG